MTATQKLNRTQLHSLAERLGIESPGNYRLPELREVVFARQRAVGEKAARDLQAARVLINQFDSINGTSLRAQLDAALHTLRPGRGPLADNVMPLRQAIRARLPGGGHVGRRDEVHAAVHAAADGLLLNLLYETQGNVEAAAELFLRRGLACTVDQEWPR